MHPTRSVWKKLFSPHITTNFILFLICQIIRHIIKSHDSPKHRVISLDETLVMFHSQ